MEPKRQKAFLKALEEIVEEKGISKEVIVDAISEAFKVAYNRKLSDDLQVFNKQVKAKKVVKSFDEEGNEIKSKLADALIRVDIDLNKGKIETFRQWQVVEEDDLEDDFIQISNKDPLVKAKKLKVGDVYEEELSFDDFNKGDVNRFISAYRQKISKAEKESLLAQFEGKIGELLTGVVEKSDEHSVIVNLGRTSVTLLGRDLIGHETYMPGENIRVYVKAIAKDEKKGGSLIQCSRSCPEFLAKLFEREVSEIQYGNVKIKKIARIAGVRSKVAVYSDDQNIDPSGACIGQSGGRIQKIVSELGNDRNSKEKIDVIDYSPNIGVLLREALKPGLVKSIYFEEVDGGKKAIAVCENETSSAAIGIKGANVILARQLCGLKELKVIDETTALEQFCDVPFVEMSVFEDEARELEREKFREASLKSAPVQPVRPVVEEVAPVVSDDEILDQYIEEENEKIEEEKTNENNLVVEEPLKNEEHKEVEIHEVKTTTTLDALEASLESEKKSIKTKGDYKKKSSNKDENKEEKIEKVNKDNIVKMDIYTKEELEELDEYEDEVEEYESDDYDEYDSDEYYEDK